MNKQMSLEEAKRTQILPLLQEWQLNQQTDITPRQVQRLLKRYQAEGLA